jgi:hypothetical protein
MKIQRAYNIWVSRAERADAKDSGHLVSKLCPRKIKTDKMWLFPLKML